MSSFNQILDGENSKDTKTKKTIKSKISDEKPIKKVKVKANIKSKNNENTDNDTDNEDNTLDNVANKYQKKTQLEHIKDLPDTYIGSIVKENSFRCIVDDTNNNDSTSTNTSTSELNLNTLKIINKDIEIVPGLHNIIEEILINALQ